MKPLEKMQGAERLWALGFLALSALGLVVALAQVHLDSGFGPAGLQARFAGPETPEIATHSIASLLQSTHTHIFTLAFLQLALGGFFLLSSAREGLKQALSGGGFVLVAMDQAAMWAAKLGGQAWVPTVMLCGIALFLGLGLEIVWCGIDLLRPRQGR